MQNKYFVLCCSILMSLALNTANIAVPFEENRGQADAKVAFQAKTLAGLLFVTKTGENATD